MYIYMYICIHPYIYICIYIYMYTYELMNDRCQTCECLMSTFTT